MDTFVDSSKHVEYCISSTKYTKTNTFEYQSV